MKNAIRAELEAAYMQDGYSPRIIVTAVKLPTGAIEVITNSMHTREKMKYLVETYDNDMVMVKNREISIVGLIIV